MHPALLYTETTIGPLPLLIFKCGRSLVSDLEELKLKSYEVAKLESSKAARLHSCRVTKSQSCIDTPKTRRDGVRVHVQMHSGGLKDK